MASCPPQTSTSVPVNTVDANARSASVVGGAGVSCHAGASAQVPATPKWQVASHTESR